MKLIVAVNNLNYIGKDGELMWRSKEDFQHFKKMTMGSSLIVGRKTFETCLGGKQLPGRNLLIVGKEHRSLVDAVSIGLMHENQNGLTAEPPATWVIGGSEIYNALIHLCDEIHISYITNNSEIGDTKFEIPGNYRGKIFEYKFEASQPAPILKE